MNKNWGFFAGIDESNHGKFPEYYVAVFSSFPSDIVSTAGLLDRDEEKNHRRLWTHLRKRDYSFLKVEREDKQRLGADIVNVAIASLLCGMPLNSHPIKVYVDAIERNKLSRTREIVAEILGIEKRSIIFAQGDDEHNPIVHYADELAHYLFRHDSHSKQAIKYKYHQRELLL